MSHPLVPCPACDRHVRSNEPSCPFCASALPEDLGAKVIPAANQRLSRAAAFVFTTSLAVTACGTTVNGTSSSGTTTGTSTGEGGGGAGGAGGGTGDGGTMALYGAPPPDDAGPGPDAGPDDDGGGSADYGAPPPDGG